MNREQWGYVALMMVLCCVITWGMTNTLLSMAINPRLEAIEHRRENVETHPTSQFTYDENGDSVAQVPQDGTSLMTTEKPVALNITMTDWAICNFNVHTVTDVVRVLPEKMKEGRMAPRTLHVYSKYFKGGIYVDDVQVWPKEEKPDG